MQRHTKSKYKQFRWHSEILYVIGNCVYIYIYIYICFLDVTDIIKCALVNLLISIVGIYMFSISVAEQLHDGRTV